jgi:hypothetical protein
MLILCGAKNETAAWLRRGTQCLPPITELDELLEELA